ncbi:MAG TPA: bifunctional 2-C-methyl-D-erythritol 4-phosphate cytidylyltransferase/2-C-methyl-D-erythritol 2,4-cyclodiphosphate synthase [Rhizomicrobium sp.]|nr:bifunctional 2-C-methyl-D-erythritol 4-phosphate cytidylyltransferase/2-C-methyl-D-erythritol 2,4-cyclodiphosphate synthase [Rhizomicrobium sp.]
MTRIAALIVGAGRGERMGGARPKQYLKLAGVPILRRSIDAFAGHAEFMLAVIGSDQSADYADVTPGLNILPPIIGGATRQESVRRGLEALIAHKPDFVLIHDAARPLVSSALIARVIAALEPGADAAIPLIAAADTLRRENADGTWSLVSRENVFRAQTPQGFRFDKILAAHREHAAHEVTDDMALAELSNLKIVRVAGEEANMKITTPEDIAYAERLLGAGETRTGMGLDAHRFAPGDHVWLCGVKIPHDQSLEGHSDADAGLHALTDAILGALGAGDIGQHFPPSDEKWRGAASSLFLQHAASLVRDAGGIIVHCDVTLICERPKIAPHRDAMRARIAEILGLDVSRISVKATTTEGMGFTGRQEGIAAQAIATLRFGQK